MNTRQCQRPRIKVNRINDQLKKIQRLSKNIKFMLKDIFEVDEFAKDPKNIKNMLKIYLCN